MKYLLVAVFVVSALGRAWADSLPYAITSVDSYWDGGTVSFAVTDSAGTRIEGCFARVLGFSEDSGKLYLGALHMNQEGARLATAAEDSVVLAVLIHALDLAYPEIQWRDKSVICSSGACELAKDANSRLLLRALAAHAGCGLPCVNRGRDRE